jgi:hypothetical protein
MKLALALTAAAFTGALLLVPSQADARAARCVIASNGSATFRGPCRFSPEAGGSFTVEPTAGKSFPGGISSISVSLMERGVAEVRGLTRAGINSRWGTAVRSQRDRACWQGSDFSVCAY